jgi:predicted nucleotidyltransferase
MAVPAMRKPDLSDQQLTALRLYLDSQSDMLQVWIIGSRAEGRSRPNSDLDMTVRLVVDHDPNQNEELCILIDHRSRWGAELTELLGILVKDIQLEFDPTDPCFGQGRSGGIRIFDRLIDRTVGKGR